ncbi:uncharacterized protein BO97DRAFT_479093 [Aspergillus homomorphus CBS 101889]|uniref:Uncharacterized protein n=1 Tax=Aspergillus homomorphus (strain CBS 101889) TaxID=1450537 RepID=A0A395HSJ1_ASPHC|nr:hypothetical protein BO97DRAFT_479093 [Aspergillus homomorphus CBS 101889]RAL10750.1 hypothetical protein BO97DRAFT_479093 [Aspergillus homomorphus CBS 101889]
MSWRNPPHKARSLRDRPVERVGREGREDGRPGFGAVGLSLGRIPEWIKKGPPPPSPAVRLAVVGRGSELTSTVGRTERAGRAGRTAGLPLRSQGTYPTFPTSANNTYTSSWVGTYLAAFYAVDRVVRPETERQRGPSSSNPIGQIQLSHQERDPSLVYCILDSSVCAALDKQGFRISFPLMDSPTHQPCVSRFRLTNGLKGSWD